MDRRLFLTGLMGVAGAAALTAAVPRQAQALAVGPEGDATTGGSLLDELKDGVVEAPETEGGEQFARHGGPHRRHYRRHYRRRRRRVRRWRNRCWRYRNQWGHWRRRCRRYPFWAWIWI